MHKFCRREIRFVGTCYASFSYEPCARKQTFEMIQTSRPLKDRKCGSFLRLTTVKRKGGFKNTPSYFMLAPAEWLHPLKGDMTLKLKVAVTRRNISCDVQRNGDESDAKTSWRILTS